MSTRRTILIVGVLAAVCLALFAYWRWDPTPEAPEKAYFRGSVVDANTEEPLSLATLVFERNGLQKRFRCDARGRFDIVIEAGEYDVFATHRGYLGGTPAGATEHYEFLPATQYINAKIGIFEAPSISGRVVDKRGQPLNAMLELRPLDPAETRLPSSAEMDGQFSYDALMPGRYALVVTMMAHIPARFDLNLSPGEHLIVEDIILEKGVLFQPKLLHAWTDEPLAGATLSVRNIANRVVAKGTSDQQGRAAIDALKHGQYQFYVEKEGFERLSRSVDLSRGEPSQKPWSMAPLHGLYLQRKNVADGEQVKVTVTIWNAASSRVIYQNRWDDVLALTDLGEETSYKLALDFDYPTGKHHRDLVLKDRAHYELVVGNESTLSLQIIDQHQQFLQGGKITLSGPQQLELSHEFVGFTTRGFNHLPAGDYRWDYVDTENNKYHGQFSLLGIEKTQVEKIEIRRDTFSYRGRLIDENGNAIKGCLIATTDGLTRARTGNNGEFTLENVDKRLSGFQAVLDDGTTQLFSGINAEAEQDKTYTFAAKRGTSQLSGVGIHLNRNAAGEYVAQSVVENAGAAAAGVLPGDVIMAVDGVTVENLKFDEVADKLRGKANTIVSVTIRREGQTSSYNIERGLVSFKR